MFDVFYIGPKPDLFAHEQQVENIEQAQTQSRTRFFWVVSYLVDYTGFDFLYEPPPWQANQRHAWPSQWHKDSGTYLVPKLGYDDTNYHPAPVLTRREDLTAWDDTSFENFDYSWHPDPSEPAMIYQFGTQWQKTGGPRYTVPRASLIKYVAAPRWTKVTHDPYWSIPKGITTESFDWTWHPDATDPAYIYQFATQHQKTGGPVYTVPGAIEVKYLAELKIHTVGNATARYEIDHLDGSAGQIPDTTRRVRYFDNYRDTLIRIAKSIGDEHEYVWICSSICDYTNFDWSWHPEKWQATMLHVFASDEQKFGDTFFMHVPSFAARAETVELLDWYDCNFVDPYLSVPRKPIPIIKHNYDSHVDAVLTQDFSGPLAIFSTGNTSSKGIRPPAVSLWREKTKTIVPLSPGAGSVIVPKTTIPYIKTQLYDYPYIDKTHCDDRIDSLMDVVFISYDEPDAEQNWNILAQRCARAKRVHGVAGMETALEAAADLSSTPWYYAVFAKTRLHEQFDFSYVPDRMQQPKNYIFDCINTVNGLQYGHMGIVMYNCEGIRALNRANNFGLDYTLSFAHESVPIVSCYGDFNQTPYHTWRTAFRECAKLAYFESQSPTVDGEYRLNTWLSRAQGNHAEWCLKGAHDGVEFFKAGDQALATLKQSFRWEWLREYFISRYGDLQ